MSIYSHPRLQQPSLADSQYSADSMQQMCNNLCYTYARATRSVSVSSHLPQSIQLILQIVPVAYVSSSYMSSDRT
jgi:hypothetical protein